MVMLAAGRLALRSATRKLALARFSFSTADLLVGHLDQVPDYLRAGTIDALLLRPLPVLAQLVLIDISLRRAARAVLFAVLLVIALTNLRLVWTPAHELLLFATLVGGTAICCAVFITAAAAQFRLIDAGEGRQRVHLRRPLCRPSSPPRCYRSRCGSCSPPSSPRSRRTGQPEQHPGRDPPPAADPLDHTPRRARRPSRPGRPSRHPGPPALPRRADARRVRGGPAARTRAADPRRADGRSRRAQQGAAAGVPARGERRGFRRRIRRWRARSIAFAPQQVSAATVLNRITTHLEVRDLAITEPDIEDVVRRLYQSAGVQPDPC